MERKRASRILIDWIAVNAGSEVPLYAQLYKALHHSVINGRLGPGDVLPSSRSFAIELGVSRNTVLNAYEQLISEGLLVAVPGGQTVVSSSLQSHLAPDEGRTMPEEPGSSIRGELSTCGRCFTNLEFRSPTPAAFTPGIPSVEVFPRHIWSRLLAQAGCRLDAALCGIDDRERSYGPLREILTVYLRSSRMVKCEPDQIVIMASKHSALDLAIRLLSEPNDQVIVEEPGSGVARRVVQAAGRRTIPVAVDSEGIQIGAETGDLSGARLAYVTPAYQWPLGVTLSSFRREALIAWAHANKAWIIEDDLGGEFRFLGPPHASIQGLDHGERTMYVGTFSKTLHPGIRTAFLVAPRVLAGIFTQAAFHTGQEVSLPLQYALFKLFDEGHFVAHLRRMRQIYKRRQGLLIHALARCLGDTIDLERPSGGLQVSIILPKSLDAEAAAVAGRTIGLYLQPLGCYYATKVRLNGLHLGFARVPDSEIESCVQRMGSALEVASRS